MSTPISLSATPSSLKHRNRQLVLECFRDHREHSVAESIRYAPADVLKGFFACAEVAGR